MILCEMCAMFQGVRQPATMCCGGLDVPMLHFCAAHGQVHACNCPDIHSGKAQLVMMGEQFMSNRKTYLGDAVYVDFDGYEFTLTTEDGIRATNTIVLEPQVYVALMNYVKECVGKTK